MGSVEALLSKAKSTVGFHARNNRRLVPLRSPTIAKTRFLRCSVTTLQIDLGNISEACTAAMSIKGIFA